MKIKLFNNKRSFKKGGTIASPDFLWIVLLSFAGILIISSFIFSFFFFKKINSEAFLDNGVESKTIDTIKKERLDKTLKYFSARKSKSFDILNSPSSLIDPSI